MPGVNVLNIQGLEVVNFLGIACVRFKKVDGAGRGRNIDTMQQRRFDRQLPLPGLPAAAAHLVAGYKPDISRSGIEKVLIACPLGWTTLWTVQITLSEEKKWVDITPLRFTGTERYQRPSEGGTASGDEGG
jgi:hypothetical protein